MLQLTDKKNKLALYLIFLLILSTTSNKTFENKKYSTKIDKIIISGLSDHNNLQLSNRLDNSFYKNIFFLNKNDIRKVISEYTIIESYTIKKIYPSQLNIDIKPTKFIAKISGDSQLLVGSNGKLIRDKNYDKILPYIFGEFDSNRFLKFIKIIENSKFIFSDIKSVFFYPSNRYDILTKNDILIKLPENNISQPLNFAYKIINDNQFINNKTIDLRVINQLIIK